MQVPQDFGKILKIVSNGTRISAILNEDGELFLAGNIKLTNGVFSKVIVPGRELLPFTHVACGMEHVVAILDKRLIVTTGTNSYGQVCEQCLFIFCSLAATLQSSSKLYSHLNRPQSPFLALHVVIFFPLLYLPILLRCIPNCTPLRATSV